jgi:hypothetical protein
MADHIELAAHSWRPGLSPVVLHGGVWDDRLVGVQNPCASVIGINGPRHGNHGVWIMHRYERRGERYEYVRTEVANIEAVE